MSLIGGSKTAYVSPDKKLQVFNSKPLTRQSNLKLNSVSTNSNGSGSRSNLGKKSFAGESNSNTLSMRLTQVLGTKKTNTKSYLNAPLSKSTTNLNIGKSPKYPVS